VVDIETTGLSAAADEIIEIGALIVCADKIEAEFQALVRPKSRLPPAVKQLTGLTDEILEAKGEKLADAIGSFLKFIGSLPVISHNAEFDYGFLRKACGDSGLPLFSNPSIDTCELARRLVKGVVDYKLSTLAAHFKLNAGDGHRSLTDCLTTKQLYEKLNEIR
jgi:DNA polymerase III epsilon subunit family exonuclease